MTPSARDSDAAAAVAAMDAAELLWYLGDDDAGAESTSATAHGLHAPASGSLNVLGFGDPADPTWTNPANGANGAAQDAALAHDCEHLLALHLNPLPAASDECRAAGFYSELLGAGAPSLEVLDTWQFVPLSNGSDSDSTVTSPSTTERREDVPVPKKKPKSTSQRQREELDYLRAKVDELEGALRTMKSAHSVTAVQEAVYHGEGQQSLWEEAAQRQLDAKKRAEQENIRLRAQLRRQVKFAKSLERTLRKRKVSGAISPTLVEAVDPVNDFPVFCYCARWLAGTIQVWDILEESKQQRLLELNTTDASILAMLKHNVNARTRNVNMLFDTLERKRAAARRSMNYLEPEIVADPLNGVHINFDRNMSIPFELHKIADVVWNLLQMSDIELKDLNQSAYILEQTDDVLVMKQSVALTVANVAHYTSSHIVFKRIVEENRVLLLWETLKEIRQSPLSEKADVQVLVKGCALLVETSNTSKGSATAGQTWVCVMPTMALPFAAAAVPEEEVMEDRTVEPQHADGPGMLTELIISSFEQNTQLMLQYMENVLFDDLVKGAVGSM